MNTRLCLECWIAFDVTLEKLPEKHRIFRLNKDFQAEDLIVRAPATREVLLTKMHKNDTEWKLQVATFFRKTTICFYGKALPCYLTYKDIKFDNFVSPNQ